MKNKFRQQQQQKYKTLIQGEIIKDLTLTSWFWIQHRINSEIWRQTHTHTTGYKTFVETNSNNSQILLSLFIIITYVSLKKSTVNPKYFFLIN